MVSRASALRRQLSGASGWALVLAGLIANQGSILAVQIIVARRVLPVEYARYLATAALLTLLVVAPNLGLDTWLLVEGGSQRARLASAWRGAGRVRVTLLGLWLAVIAVVALWFPPDAYPYFLTLATAIGVAADSVSLLSYSALRRSGRHGWVAVLQSALSVALLLAVLLVPFDQAQVLVFVAARAIISVISALVTVLFVRSVLGAPRGALGTRGLFGSARAYLLSDFASAVYQKADLSLVAFMLGAAAASLYAPALFLVNACFLLPNALYIFVLPRLSDARLHGRPGAFRRIALLQLALQAGSGLALSAAVFLLAPVVVSAALGVSYAESAFLMRVLSPVLLLKSLNFGLAALLSTQRMQAWRALAQVACAIFNVAANLAVMQPVGVVGVALVYALSEGFLFFGYTLSALRLRHPVRQA